MPHVCSAPALIAVKVSSVATGVGVSRFTSWPLPSLPRVPRPQQYAAPAVVIPQVWFCPALIDANVSSPDTAAGASCRSSEPVPSLPDVPAPQQYATPPVLIAHECDGPT